MSKEFRSVSSSPAGEARLTELPVFEEAQPRPTADREEADAATCARGKDLVGQDDLAVVCENLNGGRIDEHVGVESVRRVDVSRHE